MQTQVAWIDDIHHMTVHANNIEALARQGNPVIHWREKNRYYGTKIDAVHHNNIAIIKYSDEMPMGETLILKWADQDIPIYPRGIVRTEWFDSHYGAVDSKLGADCNRERTVFTIWAPTAASVILFINDESYHLKKEERGIWKITLSGDWHGSPYHYAVTVNGRRNIVNDPYAKSMLANSERGVVIDFSRTDQLPSSATHATNQSDAIIYELHVRDATVHPDSGVKNKGKFLGLTEKNTTTESGASTALSYIKELGCTHVQLLPVNDFARVDEINPEKDYNWGYDPLYYQVPEGSYSTEPTNPIARINQLKQLIDTFHEEGLSVILDVVYNHVYQLEKSDFEGIVPGYYFRYHLDGSVSNGTGVGNDIASERSMVRKFILDTVDFWLKEYKIDGFRFDLMGIHDVETMLEIKSRAEQEKRPILLLGEGWNMGTALPEHLRASSMNSRKLPGIRFFNDYFRDTLKGSLFSNHDTGYINGNGRFIERMPHIVTGSVLPEYGKPFVSDIDQVVNYVECHDNHTLWDRLKITNPLTPDSIRRKMHQLATGITLLSQGVPFIHAGQEWFRTKFGDGNSYISGDRINQLDWEQREAEQENIDFVKQLIDLRKRVPLFRLQTKEEIRERFVVLQTPSTVFGYSLLGDDRDLAIYINPTQQQFKLHLPYSGKWEIVLSNDLKRQEKQREVIGEFADIGAYELIVFERKRK